MCTGLRVMCPLFCSYFNDTSTSSKFFQKTLVYKFPWNFLQWEPSCSRTTEEDRTNRQRDRQTDMTQLIFSFRNFSKAPKIILWRRAFLCYCHVNKQLARIIQIWSAFYGSVDPPRTRPRASNKTNKRCSVFFSWFQFEHATAFYVRLWLC